MLNLGINPSGTVFLAEYRKKLSKPAEQST